MNHEPGNQDGFSLLEIVIALAFIGAIAVAAGSLVAAGVIRDDARFRHRATLLAENALEATRALAPNEVLVRSNGAPLGLHIPWGSWIVRATAGAPSGPNTLAAEAAGTAVAATTSAIPIPIDSQGNVDVSASIAVPVGSPGGWRAGFLLRSRDLENGYRVTLGASTLLIEKIEQGAATTLWSKSVTHTPGTWYALRAVADGDTITVYRNGSSQGSATDEIFSAGETLLVGENNALPLFDSVSVQGAGSWNFDVDPAPRLTAPWRRLSPDDLPGGSLDLTIQNTAPSSTLKTITARVRWLNSRGLQTLQLVTFHP